MAQGVTFNGVETLTINEFANPVWVKLRGLTLQITETESGVIVDCWRNDDETMAEPWTVEFDGERMRTR